MLDRGEKKRMLRAVSRRWSQLRSADRLLYINQPILHFVRGESIQYFQQSQDKFGGRPPNSDNDAGVSQSFREIFCCELLEIDSIVGDEGQIL